MQPRSDGPLLTKQGVAEYLGIDPDDQSAYFAAIAAIMQLPGDARDRVQSLRDPAVPKGTLLKPIHAVEGALPLIATSRSTVDVFNQMLDAGVHAGMTVTSAVLFRHSYSKAVDAGSLDEIRRLAMKVIDSLRDTSLPMDLRETLLTHANRLISAVNSYKVRGASGIVDEMDGLTGAMVRNSTRLSSKLGNPLLKRVVALATAVTAITTIINAPVAIYDGIRDFGQVVRVLETITEAPGASVVDAEIVDES